MGARALASALDAATKGNREERIFLRADRAVSYGDVMEVMNALRTAGYLKIALVGWRIVRRNDGARRWFLPAYDGAELRRWAFAAGFVVTTHALAVAGYLLLAPDEDEGTRIRRRVRRSDADARRRRRRRSSAWAGSAGCHSDAQAAGGNQTGGR